LAPVVAIAGGRFDAGLKLVLTVGWLGWGMGVISLLVLVTLLGRLDASRLSALLTLVPAVTALASVPVLGEPLHLMTLVGMAVATAGVWTVLGQRPTRAAAASGPRCPRSSAVPSRA
jgi:drug/metabolite transporter (DMT)-like permease